MLVLWTATLTPRAGDRPTGAEVGLVSTTLSAASIINVGPLMYGSDALAGTVNIITTIPLPPTRQLCTAHRFYSRMKRSEHVTLVPPRAVTFAFKVTRKYRTTIRAADVEDTRPFFARPAQTVERSPQFRLCLNAFPPVTSRMSDDKRRS